MRKTVYFVLVLILFQAITILAQSTGPKREFRATWIASVTNIDWPASTGRSVETLKLNLTDLLDNIKDAGLNAVFFQVRPECDALYKSNIEPWSHWITGVQGQAPAGDFDPLKFAIEEAHKRGIELHAWLNPYRARQASTYTRASSHVTNTHTDWILKFGNLHILNPGLPEVRNYNVSVVEDIVTRYDVDGVHFDDYFYPYPPDNMTANVTNNALDDKAFASDPRGFTDKNEWRRDNVNIQMKAISDKIKSLKPNVKFGISPFGIWKNGVPSGITGMDAYSAIYADPMAWLKQNTVDYLIPQLYWRIGGSQDYNKLMPWWADSTKKYNLHFYTGNIFGSFTTAELPNQLKANRNNSKTDGIVLFSAKHIPANTLSFRDSLKAKYFKNPALVPGMNWKDQVKPNVPTNLKWQKLVAARGDGLFWNEPTKASDNETAFMYAVYKFNSTSVQQSDIDNSSNLYNIVGTPYAALKASDNAAGTMYFAVSSLDRNYNESGISNVVSVQVTVPNKPLQIFPADLAVNQKDTLKFVWENTPHSTYNRFQLASDKDFTSLLVNQNNIADTFRTATGMKGQTTYYWRITASNLAGESVYSEVRSFTTGFPVPPQLVLPVDKSTNMTLTPTLVWNKTKTADKFRLQVADGLSILPSIIIVDTTLTDTTVTLKKLNENKIYTWSVMALNSYGNSGLAEPFKFKTLTSSGIADESKPTSYVLNQNYPNPFNPTTKISFSIPKNGFTVLKIYNMLGQQVDELISKDLNVGNYSVEFNASKLPSGVYIYVLQSGSHIISRKMMLIK
ncbi:MAG: family 10 glycosylhydrolase [Ignavibacteria bacterium]|nr:family 10 glycosylhydrolase [Ignavibacteria bacterium]